MRNGNWVFLQTESEFKAQFKDARVHEGKWKGSGNYYRTSYTQKCPRGCCYDSVVELTFVTSQISLIKEEMQELASSLKEAREKGN